MTKYISEIIYLDRDNTIDLQLKADETPIAMDGVTKVELVLSSSLKIDSQTSPEAFNWNNHKSSIPAANRKLILDLGGQTIPEGTYHAHLVVYDSVNTDGIRWDGLVLYAKS